MFGLKNRKRGWLDEMRREIERQEAEIVKGIEMYQKQLDEAPLVIERQIIEMERERIRNAGRIFLTGSFNVSLRDPRHPGSCRIDRALERDEPPRPIRAIRRRRRMIAMMQFLLLAAILAGCLLLLIAVNADSR